MRNISIYNLISNTTKILRYNYHLQKLLGKVVGMKPIILLHHIDKPVGKMIGNSVEIAEVIQSVLGNGPEDLVEIVCKIGIFSKICVLQNQNLLESV